MLDELKDRGYPYASVRLTDRPGSSDHARIISIEATPGQLARYGPIEIVGNSSVSDSVVLRQLTYRPGWRYRLSQIEESQRGSTGSRRFSSRTSKRTCRKDSSQRSCRRRSR